MMDTTQEIYLDNSATTRVSKEAAEKALYMMTECYGNPSSLHSKGFAAEKEMTAAREIIAERLSAQPGRFFHVRRHRERQHCNFGCGACEKARGQQDCDDGDRASGGAQYDGTA